MLQGPTLPNGIMQRRAPAAERPAAAPAKPAAVPGLPADFMDAEQPAPEAEAPAASSVTGSLPEGFFSVLPLALLFPSQ